jgi:hypothetical protein
MKKVKNAIRVFLNFCIIVTGQIFLLIFVLIQAIYPYKCRKCNVRMVLTLSRWNYPNIKRCPNCGGDFNDR